MTERLGFKILSAMIDPSLCHIAAVEALAAPISSEHPVLHRLHMTDAAHEISRRVQTVAIASPVCSTRLTRARTAATRFES